MKRAGYELWDLESGNAQGEYDRLDEALDVVRRNVRRSGPSVLEGIALIEFDDRGRDRIHAQGEELLRLLQPRSFAAKP